jgi:uncharacterized repeat protein (TIGR03803 family)
MFRFGGAVGFMIAGAAIIGTSVANAQTLTVLYNFTGSDGFNPVAGLTRDGAGGFYGTFLGGLSGGSGVFRVDKKGNYTTLCPAGSSPGCMDGLGTYGRLIRDSAGNLYGTTLDVGTYGAGSVFKVDPTGTTTILYNFTGGADGAQPVGGLIRDSEGNLYGTANWTNGNPNQGGVVFKLDPAGNYTVLHTFTYGAGGWGPQAGVIHDGDYLYGTTYDGGNSIACDSGHGCGTVFKLKITGKNAGEFAVLYSFTGLGDGGGPLAPLVRDSAGNLYGTTLVGGQSNVGVVFKVDTAGNETVLHSFIGGCDGAYPRWGGLIRDSAGNLYGTTTGGGCPSVHGDFYGGTVFMLDANNNETILHTFTGGPDGGFPYGRLVRDSAGNLYGTASIGGSSPPNGCQISFDQFPGCGVVFKLTP